MAYWCEMADFGNPLHKKHCGTVCRFAGTASDMIRVNDLGQISAAWHYFPLCALCATVSSKEVGKCYPEAHALYLDLHQNPELSSTKRKLR